MKPQLGFTTLQPGAATTRQNLIQVLKPSLPFAIFEQISGVLLWAYVVYVLFPCHSAVGFCISVCCDDLCWTVGMLFIQLYHHVSLRH